MSKNGGSNGMGSKVNLDGPESRIVEVNGIPGQGTANGNDYHVSVISRDQRDSPMVQTMEMKESGEPPGKAGRPGTGNGQVEVNVVDQAKEQKRQRKPLWYCKVITGHPKTAFGITLFLHILMVLISVALLRAGFDLIPLEFDRLPLDIRDDVDYLRHLAFIERDEDENAIIDRTLLSNSKQSERSQVAEIVTFFFENKEGNVFSEENLGLMRKVEEEFYNNEEFKKFCQLRNGECEKGRSVPLYMNIANQPYSNVVPFLYGLSTSQILQYHLGKDAVINGTVATSVITRSMLPLGMPLNGYNNDTHDEDEQREKIKTFLEDEFMKPGDSYYKHGVKDADGNWVMDFLYSSGSLIGSAITAQVFKDMSLAIGSVIFIVIFMCIQTGSLWVSLWAVVSIIIGFFTTNLIYRGVFDFRYLGIFHVLAIFIILGIGADDVFIFFDTWKETAHNKYPSLAHRMSDCYRKACLAMFFTSLTTAIAFIVSATSPFLAVSTFGVFAGILVAVNYLSVVIFFPTVIVTYHLYFERFRCCCCCPRGDRAVDSDANDSTAGKNHRKHFVVRFFRGPYYKFVTHKIFRWIILALYAGLLAFFIYFATELEVNQEETKFFPENSNVGKVLDRSANAFSTQNADGGVAIMLVWGLKEQDLGSCHHTDAKCFGKTVWDDEFSLNTPEAQTALKKLCDKIRSLSDDEADKLNIRRSNGGAKDLEVDCFIEEMDTFLTDKGFTFPATEATAENVMASEPDMYKNLSFPATFENYFEISMSYWLYNGFDFATSYQQPDQMIMHGPLLGEVKTEYSRSTIDSQKTGNVSYTYHYGTRLRYAAIKVNTTIRSATLGYSKGLPIRDEWEDFTAKEMLAMPDGLKGGFQISYIVNNPEQNLWHWLKIQKKLVSSAVTGILIGIGLALPILIIATHNVVTGLLATGMICCIVVSVLGVIPLAGWKLGLLESLNLVLVVGLSVDYVVHLAEGYSRSAHPNRLDRVHDMLQEVGISVLSGAVTTLGASMFLLFAYILFFTQFGIFMFCTIAFSTVYSLGLFVTIMGVIGPQNEFGSLKPLYRKIGAMCCKKKD